MARMPRASRSRGDCRLVLLAILLASCSWGRPAHAVDGAWVYENAGAPAGRVGHVWLYDPVRDRGVAALGWNYPILRDAWWFTLRGTNDWSGLFAAGDP